MHGLERLWFLAPPAEVALGVLLNLSEPQYRFLFQRVDSLSALAGCCISIEKTMEAREF